MSGKYKIVDLSSKALWMFFVPVVVIVTNPVFRFIITVIGVLTIIALVEIIRYILLDERPLYDELMAVNDEQDKREKIKKAIKLALVPVSSIIMILLLGYMLEVFFVCIS